MTICTATTAQNYVPDLPDTAPIPITSQSIPWLHYKVLQRPLDLDGHGFIEEEYFISGNANVYNWGPADGSVLDVLYSDAPYTTRFLSRRPANPADFSGNVYVGVMNPARSYDLNIFFAYMAERTTLMGVGIEAVPMYNITADRLQFHNPGRGNGHVLTFGDTRVYVAGDTEAIPEMLALQHIDVAFIPINLPYTITVEQAAEAVRTFQPTIVYPYHHRGTDVDVFEQLVGDRSEVRQRNWYP